MIDVETTIPGSVPEILDAIEMMVGEGRHLPFSASVVVNEDEVMELVDRARLTLPDELVQAQHLLDERRHLLESAEDEARAMVERADEEARRRLEEASAQAELLVASHTVLAAAQERADALLAEAEERATQVTDEADAYAREVMGSMEQHLGKALATVRNGIEALPKQKRRRR